MEPERLRATVAAAQAGEAQAYQDLLEAYGPRLYGYFARATGSAHDAEDLLAELMLRLVRRLRRYRERGRFEPWLFRIAANMVRDRIRRRQNRPATVSLDEGESNPPSGRLASRTGGVDAGLLAEERSAALQAALEKLDERTRQMILLRHFGELSFQELAEWMGCPLGTALARVHRGLRTLRKLMEERE